MAQIAGEWGGLIGAVMWNPLSSLHVLYLCFLDVLPDNESLSRKLSELRLFCDLLMGQVTEVKQAVATDEAGSAPNTEVRTATFCPLSSRTGYMVALRAGISNHELSSWRKHQTATYILSS